MGKAAQNRSGDYRGGAWPTQFPARVQGSPTPRSGRNAADVGWRLSTSLSAVPSPSPRSVGSCLTSAYSPRQRSPNPSTADRRQLIVIARRVGFQVSLEPSRPRQVVWGKEPRFGRVVIYFGASVFAAVCQ